MKAQNEPDLLFDYGDIATPNRDWLGKVTLEINALHASTAIGAIRMGRLIQDAKERISHGQFVRWVETQLPFSRVTACKLMKVAEVFGGLACKPDLHFEVTAMYDLALPSVPDEARAKAIQLAAQGQPISRERAQAIIAEFPRPYREPRRGYFEVDPESEAAANLVMGVFVQRLEDIYMNGPLGAALGRDSDDPIIRHRFVKTYELTAAGLLPEVFSNDPNPPEGLVPKSIKQVGPKYYRKFAEMLVASHEAKKRSTPEQRP